MHIALTTLIIIVSLAGALCLFLYGLTSLSGGLQKIAGPRLASILKALTYNRFTSVLTGFLMTSIVQSSSVVTVVAVSFTNAKLITFFQSIGVILGANIGTTLTIWIVALVGFKVNISIFASFVMTLGFYFYVSPKARVRYEGLGFTLIGLAILFFGLEALKDAVPTPSTGAFASFIEGIQVTSFMGLLGAVGAGMIVTVIIHSSSASTTLFEVLLYKGVVNFPTAVALVIGANIGTTIDAVLAAIGGNIGAKRAAASHVLFNIFTSAVVIVLFRPFTALVSSIAGAQTPEVELAVAHTGFNVIGNLVFLPILGPFARLVETIIPNKKIQTEEEKEEEAFHFDTTSNYQFDYSDKGLREVPEIYFAQGAKEVNTMAAITIKAIDKATRMITSSEGHHKLHERIVGYESYTDQMKIKLTRFFSILTSKSFSSHKGISMDLVMTRTTSELERINDVCLDIADNVRRLDSRKGAVRREILPFFTDVRDAMISFLNFIKSADLDFTAQSTNAMVESRLSRLQSEIKTMNEKLDAYVVNPALSTSSTEAGKESQEELIIYQIYNGFYEIGGFVLNIAQTLEKFVENPTIENQA